MKAIITTLLCFLIYTSTAQDFRTTWKTDNSGSSTATQITIPTFSGETYNYDVDWDNDGVFDEFGIVGDVTHDFGVAGTYTIRIRGQFPRIYFNYTGDKEKILSVEQWGNIAWTSMERSFYGCKNLVVNAGDVPDLSLVIDMSYMFSNASSLNQDISGWDVSTIENMNGVFSGATVFNQNIESWNVEKVTSMLGMFQNAKAFNQPIGVWNVAKVTNMGSMFASTDVFNQAIGTWNVGKVTNMSRMFSFAKTFNQDLNSWVVSEVTDMNNMFSYCSYNSPIGSWNTGKVKNMSFMFFQNKEFNQDLGLWNVGLVTNMKGMFWGTLLFDQNIGAWQVGNVTDMSVMFTWVKNFNYDISAWDVSKVTQMSGMFEGALSFNQPIGTWNVSSVINLQGMFSNAPAFNQNIDAWNVSNVNQMDYLFRGAVAFNQELNSWNVAKVTNMWGVFDGATGFNQDISSWDVSAVLNMQEMFKNAVAFDQNISSWDIANVTDMTDMFKDAKLSTTNYDALLNGWNAQVLQPNVLFDGGNSTYCTAEVARTAMIGSDGWTITDAGLSCALNTTDFVTTWKTDNPGTSSATSITMPTFSGATYNYDVDWDNDGTFDEFGLTGSVTHDFGTAGIKTIRIQGVFPRIFFNNTGDKEKILSVEQWGNGQWTSMGKSFSGCKNLVVNTGDVPDLSLVTDMSHMFSDASSLNQDISGWDVSNVTDMKSMFIFATVFNQDITGWNVANVSNMSGMFASTDEFNQPIGTWNVGNVTNMDGMFSSTRAFNQDLSAWNTAAVTNMRNMFFFSVFNSPLGNWNTAKVTTMAGMFSYTSNFNQDISTWNTAKIITMSGMFWGATAFNQDIGNWNLSAVINIDYMFNSALVFNQDIGSWDVSNVVTMQSMFSNANSFNQDISTWDVTKVIQMNYMFGQAIAFDQNIGSWNVANVTDMAGMFNNAKLSTTNYDALLNGWNAQTLQPNVTFSGGNSTYCTAEVARTAMIGTDGWTITDAGKVCSVVPICGELNSPSNGAPDIAVTSNLDWLVVATATGYKISIGTSSGATDVVDNLDLGNVLVYNPASDFMSNTTYYVTVVAYNGSGDAVTCTETNFTTETLVVVPICGELNSPSNGAPDIAVTSNLDWSAVTTATGYKISIGTSSGATDVVDNLDLGNVLIYNPSANFLSNTTYYVTVVAYNGAGDAVTCTETNFTTETLVVVPICGELDSPSNGAPDIAVTSNLDWSAVTTATGYKISIGTSSGATDVVGNLDLGNVLVYNPVSDFLSNTTYYVTVVAYNGSGDAVTCTETNFTTETVVIVPICGELNSPSNGAPDIAVTSNLDWSAVTTATGYKISIGTSSGATDVVGNLDLGNVLVYNPTSDFMSNTTYYVTVVAYNGSGDAVTCTETSFTTETLVVVPICGELDSPSNGAPDIAVTSDLDWSAVTTATGYKISIGTSSGATDVVGNLDLGNVLVYNPTSDFMSNTTYYVTVVAYNGAGDAVTCTETSFTTETLVVVPICGELDSPSNGAPDIAVTSDLDWSAVTTATGYKISIGTSSGATDVVDNLDLGNVLVYNPASDFMSNTTYYVTVVAYNGAGDAVTCTETSFTTETLVVVPICGELDSPSNGAPDIAVTSDLDWSAVTTATGYKISIGTSSGATDVVGNLDLGNVLVYNPTSDFMSNTTYYVTVVAYNGAGDAVTCTETSFTTETLVVVPICGELDSPSNGAPDIAVTSNLDWSAVATATGYKISIGTSSGATDVVDNLDLGNVLVYNPAANFLSNTTYYVTVVAYNGAGDAVTCTETSFTTERLVVVPICGELNSPSNGAPDIAVTSDLDWSAVTTATGYKISIGTSSGATDVVGNLDLGNVLVYNPTSDFLFETKYYVTIVAYNDAGNATGCDEFSFTTEEEDLPENKIKQGFSPDGDGINDYWEIKDIEQHPDNVVTVYNRWGDIVYQISGYDNASRVFRGEANKKLKMGAGVLPSGTYFFNIQISGTHNFNKLKGFLILKR